MLDWCCINSCDGDRTMDLFHQVLIKTLTHAHPAGVIHVSRLSMHTLHYIWSRGNTWHLLCSSYVSLSVCEWKFILHPMFVPVCLSYVKGAWVSEVIQVLYRGIVHFNLMSLWNPTCADHSTPNQSNPLLQPPFTFMTLCFCLSIGLGKVTSVTCD